jgi:hypothetical protein
VAEEKRYLEEDGSRGKIVVGIAGHGSIDRSVRSVQKRRECVSGTGNEAEESRCMQAKKTGNFKVS